jgi:adhesin transport system membrane fusion protein
MLNISPAPECATPKLDHGNYAAMALVGEGRAARTFGRLVTVAVVIFLGALFLPWTQNIRARGTVTSLTSRPTSADHPQHHPRTAGRVVRARRPARSKGRYHPAHQRSEAEYFDPQLLDRTQEQINAKELTSKSYEEKVHAWTPRSMRSPPSLRIKLEQAANKILQARYACRATASAWWRRETEIKVADDQLKRGEQQFKEGLISKVELERRQRGSAARQRHLDRCREQAAGCSQRTAQCRTRPGNGIRNDYRDKLSKAESEKFASMSQMYTTEGRGEQDAGGPSQLYGAGRQLHHPRTTDRIHHTCHRRAVWVNWSRKENP